MTSCRHVLLLYHLFFILHSWPFTLQFWSVKYSVHHLFLKCSKRLWSAEYVCLNLLYLDWCSSRYFLNSFSYQITGDLEWFVFVFIVCISASNVSNCSWSTLDRSNKFLKHLFMDHIIHSIMPPHQGALRKLNCHLVPLFLTNDWVSSDIICEPLSLIINVGTPLAAKNPFNTRTHAW